MSFLQPSVIENIFNSKYFQEIAIARKILEKLLYEKSKLRSKVSTLSTVRVQYIRH